MEKIAVTDLPLDQKTSEPLYFLTGDLLINRGEIVSQPVLEAMQNSGISHVLHLQPSELSEYTFRTRHKTLHIDDLEPGTSLPAPVFGSQNELLLQPNVEITSGIINRFKQRQIYEIFTKRSPEELDLDQLQKFKELYKGIKQQFDSAKQTLDKPELNHQFEEISDPETSCDAKNIDANLQEGIGANLKPSDTPMLDLMKTVDSVTFRESEIKFAFTSKYDELATQTAYLFDKLRNHTDTDGKVLRSLSSSIVHAMVGDRDLLLTLTSSRSDTNYLIKHSIHVAILSMNIAANMKLDEKQVFELGLCAFLNDVGMMFVNETVLSKPKQLTQQERLDIDRHVIHNLNLIKTLRGIPAIVPMVLYQTHERMDRSGYPKQRPGSLIHPYARIIAIADIFDAMCSKRPHREAFHPYVAMEQIVRMASTKKLDPLAVRALLSYMGLFPIGSWVEINEGYIGRVISANPSQYTRPVLRVMYQNGQPIDEMQTVDLGQVQDLKIQRWCSSPDNGNDCLKGL